MLFTGIYLAILITDLGCTIIYYHHVEKFISQQPEIIFADAGIIFFGDYIHHGADLGKDSKRRADRAVELYFQKKIKKIICVGGYEYSYWKGKPHLMKKYLLEKGIPPIDIAHDSASFNTITNWEEARKIIAMNQYKNVVIVSAPVHIYRIASLLKRENVYLTAYKYNLDVPEDYYRLFNDVNHEFISQTMNVILNDYVRNRIVFFYGKIMNTIDFF
jgi:vancomycin permeability regulator SanA